MVKVMDSFDALKKEIKAQEPNIEPQQLYAKIKKSSKYASQIALAERDGVYPFPVMIQCFNDYVVKGGPGGQYRLKDVALFVKADDKFIKIKG